MNLGRQFLSNRTRHATDERGAVAVFVGMLSLLLVVMAAFVVDIGMQRVARSDMQALADVVSLDLARHLDGSTVADYESATPSLQELANESRDRNPSTVGVVPVITVELGEIETTGIFVPADESTDTPTAIKVIASTSVEFAFTSGSGGASRSAVAAATSFACYKIGSWAAMVDTGRSALIDPVLRQMAMQTGAFSNGGAVSALSYTGLAHATVELNGLAASLGVGSINELASATVTLKRLFVAVHSIAQPRSSTAISALNILAINASPTAKVRMDKLVAADLGSGSLLGATANALDLVGGSISLINGVNVANVYLGAALPSVAYAGLTVRLAQGPHQYCGRPGSPSTAGVRADTEQLNVHLQGTLVPTTLDFVPPVISGLLSGITTARITAENNATFDLSVAGTASRLGSVTCGETQGVTLDVDNGLATITVATPLRAEVRARLFGGLNLVDAVLSVNAGVKVVARVGESSHSDVSVTVPPGKFDTPYPTGSGGITITSVTRTYGNVTANVELPLGLGAHIYLNTTQEKQLLDAILESGMSTLLSPTAPHSLSRTVIDPLLALVGARVGGSDVILDSVPALSCSKPRLVG